MDAGLPCRGNIFDRVDWVQIIECRYQSARQKAEIDLSSVVMLAYGNAVCSFLFPIHSAATVRIINKCNQHGGKEKSY